MTHDKFTGKPIDKPSDNLPEITDENCECGGKIVNRCLRCGAPQCCTLCCAEAYQETIRDLLTAVRKFGNHDEYCDKMCDEHGTCTCGWGEHHAYLKRKGYLG